MLQLKWEFVEVENWAKKVMECLIFEIEIENPQFEIVIIF
jgi:hypothetical protein